MLDLIKMNIYRLVHMISFIVLPLVMFAVCFFFVFIDASMSSAEDHSEYDDYGEDITVSEQEEQEFTLVNLVDNIASGGFVTVLIGMGATFIAVADYKNGYVKNYAGQAVPKGIGPLAKIPAVILETAVIYAAGVIAFFVFGSSMLSGFTVGSFPALLKVLGLQMLLCSAFGTFILCLANIFRASAPSIVITMYMFLLSNSVINLLNMLAAEYLNLPENFDLGVITIERYTTGAVSGAPAEFVGHAVIAAAVYLVLSAGVSFQVTKKRDI